MRIREVGKSRIVRRIFRRRARFGALIYLNEQKVCPRGRRLRSDRVPVFDVDVQIWQRADVPSQTLQ